MRVLPRTCGGEASNRDTKVRVSGTHRRTETRLRRVQWRRLAVEGGDSEACAAVDKRGDWETLNGSNLNPKPIRLNQSKCLHTIFLYLRRRGFKSR